MTIKEQLAEKKAALAELEPMLKADDVTAETIETGETLASEIADLTEKVEKAEKADEILKNIGTADNNNTDIMEVKTMSTMDELITKCKEMTDRKSGASVHFKANTDTVTSPVIAEVDRSVAPQAKAPAIADYFTNATISGNAITYFLQGAIEGAPAVTAQGAKKPQISTSFEGKTLALSKIAAYIKETDEILNDAPFLASEVEGTLVAELAKARNAHIINAVESTTGIGAETYDGTTVTFADGILASILKIKADSAFDANVVIVNPADLYTLLTSKDDNGQYYGGGYFVGPYGNGALAIPASIWGVSIFASSEITQGQALICAREAVKVWRKGGVDVKIYEQNEDDAIYNRVSLVGEERLAAAVVDLKGVVLLAGE